ncbi:MAG: Hsp70 family protein [Candidatus Delongbacteria bacterium]|jgi:molecular chaperone DnaK (HSP70)|nr:Hsp70 family protein [Candidatus Delongbacteria bacterium]
MYNIAIDFGTSNTLIGVYDIEIKEVIIEKLPGISLKMGEYYAVPSLIAYEKSDRFKIGANVDISETDPIRIFERMKLYFTKYKPRQIKIDNFKKSHKEAARDFLSLVIDFVMTKYTRAKIEKIIFTVPVDSFDIYRVFLEEMCESKGIYNFSILDEPTAVALGYGAVISPDYPYMVADFGGGTLDINILRINNAQNANKVNIYGKAGRDLGGTTIDEWLLFDFLEKQNLNINDIKNYRIELNRRLEQLKIEVNSKGKSSFEIEDKKNDYCMKYSLDRKEFEDILKKNLFVTQIQETIDSASELALMNGIKKSDIKKVFLVGGSSLLEPFVEVMKNNFGNRIEAKEPFSAVIKGACNYISGTIVEDFLHHNYSLRHFNKNRGIYEYEVIVPRKTKFPALNIKQVVVACPYSGQTEMEYKFFEVLENVYTEEKVSDITYDINGNLIVLKEQNEESKSRRVVPLNTSDNCFIKLDPPSIKSEDRVKINFHVNENRILMIDAVDLKTGEKYFEKYEVARLK